MIGSSNTYLWVFSTTFSWRSPVHAAVRLPKWKPNFDDVTLRERFPWHLPPGQVSATDTCIERKYGEGLGQAMVETPAPTAGAVGFGAKNTPQHDIILLSMIDITLIDFNAWRTP
jgi:hypothetical protein